MISHKFVIAIATMSVYLKNIYFKENDIANHLSRMLKEGSCFTSPLVYCSFMYYESDVATQNFKPNCCKWPCSHEMSTKKYVV